MEDEFLCFSYSGNTQLRFEWVFSPRYANIQREEININMSAEDRLAVTRFIKALDPYSMFKDYIGERKDRREDELQAELVGDETCSPSDEYINKCNAIFTEYEEGEAEIAKREDYLQKSLVDLGLLNTQRSARNLLIKLNPYDLEKDVESEKKR